MAGTKARGPTVELVWGWIEEGFGQDGPTGFKPFFYVRDVPGAGLSHQVNSRITGRVHSYFSNHELMVHLLAEYAMSILNIRERYALLPWEETQSIAAKLGITHPTFPRSKTPCVLTTDLLLTVRRPDGQELIAVSAALKKNLDAAAFRKLLLERIYWNRRGIRWILVTEDNLPRQLTHNLKFFEMALKDERAQRSGIDPIEFSRRFEENCSPRLTFNEVMALTQKAIGADVYTGHALLGAAAWNRTSNICLESQFLSHTEPVALQSGGESVSNQ